MLLEIRELPQKLSAKLGVKPERVARFLIDLAKYTEPVATIPAQFSYERDPDDAHYVNLAIATRATFLVARDKDLQDLMRIEDFRRRFPDLHIVTPPEFLREVSRVES